MARKIKFALEMKNGELVRDIESLREYFDIEKVVAAFLDGKLLTWLEDRYYEDEANAISNLNKNDTMLNQKLCQIFGIDNSVDIKEEIDPELIEIRNKKLLKLKQYTADEKILNNVDYVAFNQEELADLLDEGIDKIYLCQNRFIIPLRQKNKKYIGVGKVEVVIKSKTKLNFKELGIEFSNITFDKEYTKIDNISSEDILKQAKEAETCESYKIAFDLYTKAANLNNTTAMKCLMLECILKVMV